MRSNDVAQLKSIIKDAGLKGKFETVVKNTIGVNFNSYFDYVEPIYAIARCYSYFNTDKDKEAIIMADMIWADYVIRNNQCSPILPYVEKHGMERVIKAVQYLIENRLWSAPKGNCALKTKKVESYKGLADIDETVEFLDAEGLLPEKTEANNETLVDFVDADPDTLSDNPFVCAQKSLEVLLESINTINLQVPFIQRIFDGNESNSDVVDNLTKEFDESMQKMRDENIELTKTKKRLTDEKATLNVRCSNLTRELEKAKEICTDLRKQVSQKDIELIELRKFKESAKLTRGVVIPKSKFFELPLVGEKTLNVLEPMLNQFDIKIDHSR